MHAIIKKYYLMPFLGFTAAMLLKIFLKKASLINFDDLGFVMAFATLLAFLSGTLYYLQDTKWGPNKRKKIFDKSPFSELLMNKFVLEDDGVTGTVNGYAVVIRYVWPHGASAIAVNVLFKPDAGRDLEQIKERNELKGLLTEDYIWTNNAIGYIHDDTFKLPSYDTVLTTAALMIDVLKAEGLKPIRYAESEKPTLGIIPVVPSIGI